MCRQKIMFYLKTNESIVLHKYSILLHWIHEVFLGLIRIITVMKISLLYCSLLLARLNGKRSRVSSRRGSRGRRIEVGCPRWPKTWFSREVRVLRPLGLSTEWSSTPLPARQWTHALSYTRVTCLPVRLSFPLPLVGTKDGVSDSSLFEEG